ncbi:MAG TPA: glycosyltransferase [Opitutaceae bacterium]|nr:glycosyltransferase [Opitutaceae bacterium]
MSLKRLLVVSPHFPPVNAPDAHRVRVSLPYFREFGWEPVVLAVDPRRVPGTPDSRLAAALPADVAVHRCGALPRRLARLAGLGSLGPRAWWPLCTAGAGLLRRERFDLVFFSTTQFLTLALGSVWKKKSGVPFVIDIQDPWRTDYYARPGAPRPPGGWKYRFARWQAERLEEPSFRPASAFVSVSEAYLEQLRTRYSWFATKPAAVVPFGASEADFSFAQNDATLKPAFQREAGCVHLLSVGAAGPIMAEAAQTFFAGVRDFRAEQPELAGRLRIHFVGTSYASGSRAVATVRPLAEPFGVGDLVIEQPARIGYFESLKTMRAADALLLLGSNDPGYAPSKIAAYFLADRPMIAVVSAGGAAAARLAELRCACVVSPPAAGLRELRRFLTALATVPARLQIGSRNQTLFDAQFSARAGTRRLCELFDGTLEGRSGKND